INCDVYGDLFSAADRCFPRERLKPPCPKKGYADVVRKGRFYSAIIHHSAGSSDTCWDCALLVPPKTFVPAGQGRLRKLLHRTKKIDLYFRGVNGPPLQTTIIIVK